MSNVLEDLNPRQQEAVTETEGPILIVAGPGSGKTRVLTHKYAYLVKEKNILTQNILCVTFTNKAANEMRGRIKELLGSGLHAPWVRTFHATCAKILRFDGHLIGIPKNSVIYDESDSKTALRQIIKKMNLPLNRINPGAVLNTIDGAKNELVDEIEFKQYAHGFFQEKVSQLYPEYQKLLHKNEALDFGDLIFKTVRLFQEVPQSLEKYQEQFRYILVDEYQDTNHAQYIFTKLLAAKHKNLCVVGDVNQAIYSWRGANFRNILQFEKDFPEAKIFRLERNYRSTKIILQAAKGVINKSRHHLHLDLWTENETGEIINLFESRNEREEGEYIVSRILGDTNPENSSGFLSENIPSDENLKSQISNFKLNNYAVLYRTNAQSRALEETFLRWGMPYRIVGGIKFYERKEIKDVLAYLRLLLNPNDTVSRERAEKLGKNRLLRFEDFQKKVDLDDFTVLELLDQFLSRTEYLRLYAQDTEENFQRKENVKELRSVASQFSTLPEFLENVALVQQEYLPEHISFNKNSENSAVTMMTLHSAKGLEFPVVFLVGMEEGLFPHSRSMVSPEELDEERRLCYVGITRAKKDLHLTYARNRLYFGYRQTGILSRFVGDIPEHLLNFRIGGSI